MEENTTEKVDREQENLLCSIRFRFVFNGWKRTRTNDTATPQMPRSLHNKTLEVALSSRLKFSKGVLFQCSETKRLQFNLGVAICK